MKRWRRCLHCLHEFIAKPSQAGYVLHYCAELSHLANVQGASRAALSHTMCKPNTRSTACRATHRCCLVPCQQPPGRRCHCAMCTSGKSQRDYFKEKHGIK